MIIDVCIDEGSALLPALMVTWHQLMRYGKNGGLLCTHRRMVKRLRRAIRLTYATPRAVDYYNYLLLDAIFLLSTIICLGLSKRPKNVSLPCFDNIRNSGIPRCKSLRDTNRDFMLRQKDSWTRTGCRAMLICPNFYSINNPRKASN